jgi:uridylate kinase
MPSTGNGHKRVLLKLSGEALAGSKQFGYAEEAFNPIIEDIVFAHKSGVKIAIVIGGGNFLRGARDANAHITRATADQMGMIATVINGLALRDALLKKGASAKMRSAIFVSGIAKAFDIVEAREIYDSGSVLIIAGGTGNPFVTTDSAASLRSIELDADVLIKATKVDGIYSDDPKANPDAKLFSELSFEEVLKREYAVMDLAAFCQCRDYHIPIRVFNIFKDGALRRALLGESEGTLVSHLVKKSSFTVV